MTLARFPRRTLRGDRTLYRIHRAVRGAWWFSGDGSGRFDPMGSGKGACYFAEKPLGAWVEVFRKQMVWAETAVDDRALHTVELGRDLKLADLTSRRALQFGVTATVAASDDYTPSQAFAAEALAAGFDGIRYFVRHDPNQSLYGVALFGDPGEPDPAGSVWAAGSSGPIPANLRAEATRLFGYKIMPTP